MKRNLIFLFSLILIFISPKGFTQDQLKIGHVNVVEIVSVLPESDSAQILMENDTKELESMLENMQVEYNKMVNDYQQNLNSYSELVKNTKESELMEMQNRIQTFQQNASQQLQERNYELLQPIYDKIQKAINKVATREGFTYILDISKGSVVFTANNSQNINSLVLAELGIED